MNEDGPRFSLSCKDIDAPAPVLVGVQAQARLDAVLFELTLRQTYRNTSSQVLEVVYTFPLPPAAVLLGFASELNGTRQEGVIVARHEAERQYENSLKEGDAPVMLEAHGDGLHTANIGNLKPGDEIVLECRFAELLRFEQGRLRVSIPTTIAPRYGHAERAGLQPQQVPLSRVDAEYPLALTVTLGPALAGATAQCPTHRFATRIGEDGSMTLTLSPDARLDRDVVLIVTPREPRPSLVVRADDTFDTSTPVVMMAALQPSMGAPRDRIVLKLLVDCSGSMSGDSIGSARAALRGVLAGLTERDQLSLSRFGSTVEHLFAPSPPRPQTLRHLQLLVDDMRADLGGTETESALGEVFRLPGSAEHGNADVLLITDGAIWQADEMIQAARKSGHRVFAIGVGSAPAEGVLRALAESTGGACEFATPGEALEAAAQRMLHRMRQPVFANVRVDFGGPPVWSCGPLAGVFGGDTVTAFAGFERAVQGGVVRLLADNAQGNTVELARGEATAPCPGDSLPRVAAARRIADQRDVDPLALAVQYQLMSGQTHCILVHRRDVADKAAEQAELHRVGSMLAAGWGGLGTVGAVPLADRLLPDSLLSCPSVWRHARTSSAGGIRATPAAREVGVPEVPAFLRRVARDPEPATLASITQAVADHLDRAGSVQNLAHSCAGLPLHPDARQAIDDAVALGLGPDLAWLLLAHWVCRRPGGPADADLNSRLQPLVDAIDPALVQSASQVWERRLRGYPNDGWHHMPPTPGPLRYMPGDRAR